MKRSGVADLPLHGGRVPQWLADRMSKLGTAIVESVVLQYGRSELLSRICDPFWFQALGSVMGMDWHSSGITTSVMGALKRGLHDRSDELGIHICGGRGRHSRNTPMELRAIADRRGFDGEALVRTSRLTARIDNNAIADGFQIYLHTFVVTAKGEWAVVQQGLNDQNGMARRYHWHSASVRDFVNEPHTAIVGENQGTIMNLVDSRADRAQTALLEIANEHPEKISISNESEQCWQLRTNVAFAISLSCCYSRNLDHALCNRWHSSLKWFTVRRVGSTIPRVFHSHTAAKTDTQRQCL